MKRSACLLVLVYLVPAAAADEVDYTRDVKSVLRERCYSCHGALKQEAGLRLDTVALVVKGGETGPAIVPGNAESSLLIQRIAESDASLRMPPEGKPLTEVQIAGLRKWIDAGAKSPGDERPEEDPRSHWAFQKPVRPPVPLIPGHPEQHPIDAFVSARRERSDVVPMPKADKATLLRRVFLDLTGLPPSADDLQMFLKDDSSAAWSSAVDRLLASPQYGERWGRHWMDVWRYSDWYGRRSVPDVMNSYPMVWRWRDWIVRSLNEDKPYNQMVVEMLAADELMPENENSVVATGYLVRSWFKWNYETWKKDLVEHTGKAFLGLTLNCTQCHDHKYDPISQEEYFRFRAFFEPLELRHDRYPGDADPGPFKKYVYAQSYGPISSGMVRVFDEYLDAETFMFSKGDSRLRIEGKPPVTPGAPAALHGETLKVSPITLPITAAYPGMKTFLRDEERSRIRQQLTTAETGLADAKAKLQLQPEALQTELQAAEKGLKDAREKAVRELQGSSSASILQGIQSLSLNAATGRRALSHSLPGLDSLSDQGRVSFLVQIQQDGHTNLQLALDVAQGATGGYVGFEGGLIKTYSPGGFQEIVAGRYDLSKGQNRFLAVLQLDLSRDLFLLTVTSLGDNAVIADAVPAALNGWRPQSNGKRGVFLDCRPGTQAVYDDLKFCQPDGSVVASCDFEPPAYDDGRDLVDIVPVPGSAKSFSTPWMVTTFCQAPATSLITSAVSQNAAVQAAVTRVASAKKALSLPMLRVDAAEARRLAAESALRSLEKRIAADDARYSTGIIAQDRKAEPEIQALIREAIQAERDAAVATAQAELLSADEQIADSEATIATAGQSSDQAAAESAQKTLQAAQKNRANAVTALASAKAALSGEFGEYTPLSPKYPQQSSGRRSVLAKWIASNDNPLTARVAVNHIWLRHFGKALVESTHDFGRNGSRPTHPELLDWLACELMESGWSMKHLHRLIVSSETYQMASSLPFSAGGDSDAIRRSERADQDNLLMWRFPASRMQAEVVRDSLLSVAGELDTTIGGHEIDHRQGLTSYRRSLYFAHHGEEKMEFLELFDAANACDCYKRTSSVQPQQALALTNSELTMTLSRKLARRLWDRTVAEAAVTTGSDSAANVSGSSLSGASVAVPDSNPAFVQLAFLQILNREARAEELEASIEFLQEQAGRVRPVSDATSAIHPEERARENLVHALMNHNDFVTIR